jgi:mannose-6-phosphate isomerase-like protein (cupin superfamily)
MILFDLKTIKTFPYKDRDKNVFFKSNDFKVRMIALAKNEENPCCEMKDSVIFYVIDGEGEIEVNSKKDKIFAGNCIVTEPSKISLKTKNGIKILGIQIKGGN